MNPIEKIENRSERMFATIENIKSKIDNIPVGMFPGISKDNPVIAWWSGGVTSAVTCKLCVDWFGDLLFDL